MKESYREGIASHSGPEPCEGGREAALEALDRGICRLGMSSEVVCSGEPTPSDQRANAIRVLHARQRGESTRSLPTKSFGPDVSMRFPEPAMEYAGAANSFIQAARMYRGRDFQFDAR